MSKANFQIPPERQRVAEAYNRLGGNVRAVSQELGICTSTVYYHIRKLGGNKKPIVGGSLQGIVHKPSKLPPEGRIKRYLLTSAQNNSHIHKEAWENLLALAEHYKAKLLIGTYSYNMNAYGELSVKRGTFKAGDKELWFDDRLKKYFSDERMELANGLVWCGEMNIIPTAEDPLSGLETYSGRKSAIFPHAKMAMRSIATMKGEGTKLNYTTGTITLRNYIQKKAGLKAEHHHTYGALLVEVNSDGNWWVRQLEAAEEDGRIQDLDVVADQGRVTTGNPVEAITWGDLHSTSIDETVLHLSMDMLDALKPRYQFLHDIINGTSVNHHEEKNPHEKFKNFLRGYGVVENELQRTAEILGMFERSYTKTVVVDSNHDNWLTRWLREHDYRRSPQNAVFFLEAQLAVYKAIESQNKLFNLTEWAMQQFSFECTKAIQYLRTDESFRICDGKIECGMHGHLGPNGARGNALNLAKVGRRANIGHTHSAGIHNGLYVAGTSSLLDVDYNVGPSSWTHSHIVTYPNGKRSIITMYAERWKA